jgi:hypothetical protein
VWWQGAIHALRMNEHGVMSAGADGSLKVFDIDKVGM